MHTEDVSSGTTHRFEIHLKTEAETHKICITLCHPNNQTLLQHCQYVKIVTKHVKWNIVSHSHTFCQVVLVNRSYLKKPWDPSEPVTITEQLSVECVTCTVVTDTPPGFTDLHMDCGDGYRLGRNGERYFLLLVDKTTEYYVTFNTTCQVETQIFHTFKLSP